MARDDPCTGDPEPADPLAFPPVPLRRRHDGWTAARQVAFIHALAESGCVEEACRRVGKSRQSVYALRRAPDAELFRMAWDAALDQAMNQLETAALSRALHGVARPIFFRGEQVGEWRDYDERLAMFLLRYRRSARYGGWMDGRDAPLPGLGSAWGDSEDAPYDDSAGRLDYFCEEIEALECRFHGEDRGTAADHGPDAPPGANEA